MMFLYVPIEYTIEYSIYSHHLGEFYGEKYGDQDPDWKTNSLLVGQPGYMRGHAVRDPSVLRGQKCHVCHRKLRAKLEKSWCLKCL